MPDTYMQSLSHHIYQFDDFTLDLTGGCLLREGQEVKLRPKVFEALKYLVENNNRLVSKAELIKAVWTDSFVTDDSIVQCLVELRRALGDDAQQLIKTVPRRGYIFMAQVSQGSPPMPGVIYAEQVEGVKVVIEEARSDFTQMINRARATVESKIRQPALGVVLVILVLISVGLYLFLRGEKPVGKEIHSIAVLPLGNASADPNVEYLSDGITESIINSLSQSPKLKVMARATVFRYKGQQTDPLKVGRDLKVEAVLTGKVIQQGDNLVIRVELVNVTDGTQLWGEKYDRKLSDIFAVQEEIAKHISEKLRLKLTDEEQKRLTKRYTGNADAYQAYLMGRYFWNRRSEDGMKKGIQYFQRAIDTDPGYALAYAGLADCHLLLFSYSFLPPKESAPKAWAAATKALELDDSLAEAHTSLAWFKFSYDRDWAGAEREFRRAIELNPNYATAHHWYGFYLALLGRFDEGLAEMRRAQELDPQSLIIHTNVGRLLYFARQYDAAIEQLKSTLEMEPNFSSAREKLAEAYEAKQMYPEAIAEYQKWATLDGDDELASKLGQGYATSGYRGAIRKWIDHIGTTREQDFTLLALLYSALGDKDQAFYWLEKAYQAHSTWLDHLRVHPMFDNLRADPRFADLLRRIGLDQ